MVVRFHHGAPVLGCIQQIKHFFWYKKKKRILLYMPMYFVHWLQINTSMTKYHSSIKLPVPFVPYERGSNTFEEVAVENGLVNKEFKQWLKSLGLTFKHGRFFNSPPYKKYNLHIDGDEEKDCVKLNLVFDSHDTVMNWYEPLPGYKGIHHNNTVGEPILYFEKDKCRVLHTTQVNSHCILNGNVIHDLVNGPNQGVSRKCYSILLLNAKTQERLKWSEALEILGPYLVDN